MAVSSLQLGMAAQQRRRLEEAEGWFRQTVALSRELGNQAVVAVSYLNLGRVAEDLGCRTADPGEPTAAKMCQNLASRPA
jgi:hypothetical protein